MLYMIYCKLYIELIFKITLTIILFITGKYQNHRLLLMDVNREKSSRMKSVKKL